MKVSVLTVTYNRAHCLKALYDSLCGQSRQDFQWLIIDDGSSDQTEELVRFFQQQAAGFTIDYVRQANGGKHSGLNASHAFLTGEVMVIVDSDDVLVENGIQMITEAWQRYGQQQDIATITFERRDQAGQLLGKFPQPLYQGSELDYRYKGAMVGDFSETVRTSAFKEVVFPIYTDERFFPEGYLWAKLAQQYLTVDISDTLIVGGYQEGGLTQQGRKNRLKAPQAMLAYYQELMQPAFPLVTRLKAGIAAQVYRWQVSPSQRPVIVGSAWLKALTWLPARVLASRFKAGS